MLKFYEIITLATTSSTNEFVTKRLLLKNRNYPVAVNALFQTHGRGYGSNFWHSNAGENLLVSLLVFPEFLKPAEIFQISKITSLAVVDFLSNYINEKIFIKWPNDIYINDKKISGILIKNELEHDHVRNSIIGAGININQQKFPDNIPNPVSLGRLTGKKYKIDELFKQFLQCFINRYNQINETAFEIIHKEYMQKLYLLNQNHRFYTDGEAFEGVIKDVMPDGRIKIKTKKGNRLFGFKEVGF